MKLFEFKSICITYPIYLKIHSYVIFTFFFLKQTFLHSFYSLLLLAIFIIFIIILIFEIVTGEISIKNSKQVAKR